MTLRRAALACVLGLLLPAAYAASPNPEPMDLDANLLAEVARQRLRASAAARQADRQRQGKLVDPTVECGALAIGNVIGNQRVGFAPVEVNVVVVGDVVNANNRCR
jgi:hypothetical protein